MYLLEFGGELVEASEPAHGLVRSIVGDGLIEPLDAIVEEVEAGHVVLDPVDALEVSVDDLERLFELVQAVGDGG